MKTAVFSSDLSFIKEICKQLDICVICSEKRRNVRQIKAFSERKNVSFHAFSSKEDFVSFLPDFDLGLTFGFGLIFSKSQLDRIKSGVINFHPGKLPEYGGRHAIGWAILNGLQRLTISAHLINEEIDRGKLIAERELKIDLQDDVAALQQKVVLELAEGGFFKETLEKHRNAKFSDIPNGNYLPNLAGLWDDVNSADCDSIFLFNLVRCKRSFGGLVVDGTRVDRAFFLSDLKSRNTNDLLVECKDGIVLALRQCD